MAMALGIGQKYLVLVAAAIVLAVLPLVAPPWISILVSYGLINGIAGVGYNLLLGYSGLLSFGHAAYWGVGAYAVAFMVKFLQIRSMEAFIAGALLASAAISIAFGALCVRSTRIFFAILTQALSLVLWSLIYKFYWVTGGSDGLRVPKPDLLGMDFRGVPLLSFLTHIYYYYVLAIFLVTIVVMWVIVNSPFGRTIQAIRDNETRARFVGISVPRYRWYAFIISGIYTGLAGALWAPLNGLTTPDIMYWLFSGEIVFITLLGGFQSFVGPILGGMAFNIMKTYAIGLTIYWQLLLGVIVIGLVLVLPTGIMGGLTTLANKFRRTK